MTANEVVRKANEFGITRLAAARMRARYLLEAIEAFQADGSDLAYLWQLDAEDELLGLFHMLSRPIIESRNGITDDDIQRAKDYPIEELVQFDRMGKCLAFCHEEKTPSMSWHRKRNRAHCFGCGRSFNAIDVLMVRDGLSFIDAVKRLI